MKVCHHLNPRQAAQLHTLYQQQSWSAGRTLEETERGLQGSSFYIALLDDHDNLAAFTRVLTDGIFKALVFDVIVDEQYRGAGLGNQLVALVKAHPAVARVKHIELYCKPELEAFYEQHGFSTEVSNMRLMRFVSR